MTVSIVTYNTDLSELDCCLSCLSASCVDRIWIIDNSSSAQISDHVSGLDDQRITYIPAENRGYGAGHNIAINEALAYAPTDGLHLIINTDIRFDPEILQTLKDVCQKDSTVGMIQPLILGPDKKCHYSARRLPTPYDLILRRFLPASWAKKRRARYLLKDRNLEQPLIVPYLSGSFMLVRLQALRDCGLFDERFFMYPEDIDLTRQIRAKYKTVYYPAVSIVHDHRAASYSSPRMLRVHASNMIKYFNKWGWFFDRQRRQMNDAIGPYIPEQQTHT